MFEDSVEYTARLCLKQKAKELIIKAETCIPITGNFAHLRVHSHSLVSSSLFSEEVVECLMSAGPTS